MRPASATPSSSRSSGADLVPGLVYYRAKVLQEDILKAGPVPYSIVRATQFFEFMDAAVAGNADENTVRLPATLIQPIASADVAGAVADASAGPPLRGTANVAGPEVFPLDEIGRITLDAHGDHRTVVTDNSAGMFARRLGRRPHRQGRHRHRQDHLPGVARPLARPAPTAPAVIGAAGRFLLLSELGPISISRFCGS